MSWVRKGKVAFVASLLLSISPSPFEYEDGVMSELKAEFTNLVSKQKLQGNQRVGQRSTVARISNGYSVRAASFIRTVVNVPTYRFGVSLNLWKGQIGTLWCADQRQKIKGGVKAQKCVQNNNIMAI